MLKALMLRKRIDLKKKEVATLREKLDGFKTPEVLFDDADEQALAK